MAIEEQLRAAINLKTDQPAEWFDDTKPIVYQDFAQGVIRYLGDQLTILQQRFSTLLSHESAITAEMIHDIRWQIMIAATAQAHKELSKGNLFIVEKRHIDTAVSAISTNLSSISI